MDKEKLYCSLYNVWAIGYEIHVRSTLDNLAYFYHTVTSIPRDFPSGHEGGHIH